MLPFAGSAQAWDQHHELTEGTLRGFEVKDPALWQTLTTHVEIRPIESLVAKAFGSSCNWDGMKDSVLDGVGERYSVRFAEGFRYTLSMDWEKGTNRVRYEFLPLEGENSQAVGKWVQPLSVIGVYSDEPDWEMDDDVPRLKNVGVAKGIEGTGTRILRHFWYGGETKYGIDISEGQELDRRAQRLYELALIAFDAGEPYWGYRFLGQTIHYLQDLTQPFHVRGVLHDKMIYKVDFISAKLCEYLIKLKGNGEPLPPECRPGNTVANALVKSGWLLGALHGAYEDLAKGLLESDSQSSSNHLADLLGIHERYEDIALQTIPRSAAGLLSMRPFISQVQRNIVTDFSAAVGEHLFRAFGKEYRYNADFIRQDLPHNGSKAAFGYRVGSTPIEISPLADAKARQALADLFEVTNALFARTGVWGRLLIRSALESRSVAQKAEIEKLRVQLSKDCAAASASPR